MCSKEKLQAMHTASGMKEVGKQKDTQSNNSSFNQSLLISENETMSPNTEESSNVPDMKQETTKKEILVPTQGEFFLQKLNCCITLTSMGNFSKVFLLKNPKQWCTPIRWFGETGPLVIPIHQFINS
jgi:hypothetical protein